MKLPPNFDRKLWFTATLIPNKAQFVYAYKCRFACILLRFVQFQCGRSLLICISLALICEELRWWLCVLHYGVHPFKSCSSWLLAHVQLANSSMPVMIIQNINSYSYFPLSGGWVHHPQTEYNYKGFDSTPDCVRYWKGTFGIETHIVTITQIYLLRYRDRITFFGKNRFHTSIRPEGWETFLALLKS